LLLGFLPVIGPVARLLSMILATLGVWIGVATANELKGWRSLILPVIYLLVFVVSAVFIAAAITGIQFTINNLLAEVGWTAAP